MVRSCHPLIVTWVQLADIQLSSRRPWLQLSSPGMRCEAKAWLRGWLLSSCSTARWGGLTFDHRNYIIYIYIWVNCNSSLTWIVGPFWDDFPQSNHDSRVRENSEVVMKFTQICIYIYICICIWWVTTCYNHILKRGLEIPKPNGGLVRWKNHPLAHHPHIFPRIALENPRVRWKLFFSSYPATAVLLVLENHILLVKMIYHSN